MGLFTPNAAKVRDQQQGCTTLADKVDTPGLAVTAWDQHLVKPKYPPLQQGLHADVVVIGAGIAGACVAYNLQREGKNVVILEKGVRCCGQTGRTTAHIMLWNDDYYYMLEKEWGTERTTIVAQSHKGAADYIERVCQEEGIDCKFRRVPGYLYPHNDSSSTHKMLESELQAAQRCGFPEVQIVELPGTPAVGGIKKALLFPNCADFHPVAFVEGVLDAFVKRGGKIYEHTHCKWTGGGKVMANGQEVTGDSVILATNSPISRNLAIHARQTADRSYVVGLKVAKGKIQKASYWDTNTPYHYVRIEPKEQYDVLIVGGEDHTAGINPGSYTDAYAALEEYARERWTDVGEVLYRWSGQVYEPVDKLGYYGRDPAKGNTNVFIITGDSGQGMTGGAIGAAIVRDLILDRPNPWADVYTPNRLPNPLRDFTSIVEEGMKNIEGFSKLVLPKLEDPGQLLPGEGCVAQKGVHKAAVYKDDAGVIHACSAVCPHMGGLCEWNPKEKTFDCPCHGSQFDRYGRCIQGPAVSDLSKLDW